jgi:hypothetical protein
VGRTAVKPPSGFIVTVAPAGVPETLAVSGYPEGSLAKVNTPGAFTLIILDLLLVKVAEPAVGALPLHVPVHEARVTVA